MDMLFSILEGIMVIKIIIYILCFPRVIYKINEDRIQILKERLDHPNSWPMLWRLVYYTIMTPWEIILAFFGLELEI